MKEIKNMSALKKLNSMFVNINAFNDLTQYWLYMFHKATIFDDFSLVSIYYNELYGYLWALEQTGCIEPTKRLVIVQELIHYGDSL